MTKILTLFASIFLGKIMSTAKPASAYVIEMVVAQSRTIVMIFVGALTFSFLLAGGIFLSVTAGVSWFDGTAPSPNLFYAGLAICAVSIFFLTVLFSKKNWVVSEEAKRILEHKPEVAPVKSPVEDLISLFVSEYAKASAEKPVVVQPQPQAQAAPPSTSVSTQGSGGVI